jgi:hypothetical protein
MRRTLICALLGLGLAGAASQTPAATCAAGVYRAGCAGPNGAVVAPKPVSPPPAHVNCAAGAYHAGCAGPNGAVVTNKAPAPYAPRCYWNHGVKVCH